MFNVRHAAIIALAYTFHFIAPEAALAQRHALPSKEAKQLERYLSALRDHITGIPGDIDVEISLTPPSLDCDRRVVDASGELRLSGSVHRLGVDVDVSAEQSFHVTVSRSGVSGMLNGGSITLQGSAKFPKDPVTGLRPPGSVSGQIPVKLPQLAINSALLGPPPFPVEDLIDKLCGRKPPDKPPQPPEEPGDGSKGVNGCCCCMLIYREFLQWDPCSCTYIRNVVPMISCGPPSRLVTGREPPPKYDTVPYGNLLPTSPRNVKMTRYYTDTFGVARSEDVYVTREFASKWGYRPDVKMVKRWTDEMGQPRHKEVYATKEFAAKWGYTPDTVKDKLETRQDFAESQRRERSNALPKSRVVRSAARGIKEEQTGQKQATN